MILLIILFLVPCALAGCCVSNLIDAIRATDPEEANAKKERAIGFAMATVLVMKINVTIS